MANQKIGILELLIKLLVDDLVLNALVTIMTLLALLTLTIYNECICFVKGV
jgi:hypothetical protein